MNLTRRCLIACLIMVNTVAFAQESRQLDEVTVIASRTVSTAGGYTTSLRGTDIVKGKPAYDILGFLPNISRENGKFKINGLQASEIYVDGVKVSDLSELGNIPGEMIDKVQVKYLAGTDQNAALSGGTIMITLRKPPKGGFYGSVKAKTEWRRSCSFGNGGGGAVFNYRYNNLSIYDNLYLDNNKVKEKSEQWQTGTDLQTLLKETLKAETFRFRNRLSLTQHFKSGAQLGGSYFVATSRPNQSSDTYEGNNLSSIDKRINSTLQEGTLQFSLPIDKKGTSMELAADYLNFNNENKTGYFSGNDKTGGITEKNNTDLWKFKADFMYPHSRKLAWKFGASAQLVSGSYSPYAITESDRFTSSDIPTKTNGLTPAVYAEAQGMIWKLRYTAGMRWQLNRITYEDLNANVKSHNTQWAINPTIQVMMPLGKRNGHALMLSYKRTLGDIPYTAISSVITWSDPYNYTVGNPKLKAQSADMVMAGLSLFRNKLNITAVYAYSHDRIYWQTFQDADNKEVFYTKPTNISGQNLYGFGAEWMENPFKWWRFKLSGRVEITPEDLVMDDIYLVRQDSRNTSTSTIILSLHTAGEACSTLISSRSIRLSTGLTMPCTT